jgi:hypothetical protein
MFNEVFSGRHPRQDIYKIRRFGDCLHHQGTDMTRHAICPVYIHMDGLAHGWKRANRCRWAEFEYCCDLIGWQLQFAVVSVWVHVPFFSETHRLLRTEGYTDCLVKEAIEIQLHPNNFNRDGGFILRRAWQRSLEQFTTVPPSCMEPELCVPVTRPYKGSVTDRGPT